MFSFKPTDIRFAFVLLRSSGRCPYKLRLDDKAIYLQVAMYVKKYVSGDQNTQA